ncbi:MAG: A/G-specific adenine glycosylase [Patescibacteria group bacterium]
MIIKPSIKQFQKVIWGYHAEHRRSLPWRRTRDPYKILVSEMMLQQTQVGRVLEKYRSFLKKFPSIKILATAPLQEVLLEWQGLGYNRRALYLKKTAKTVANDHNGKFPQTQEELLKLPGIGQSTAGALLAFAYNLPAIFVETNIRSVFLHFFFKDISSVPDTMIRELVEKTFDYSNPREWYYALYDYGTMLKKSVDANTRSVHRKSKHYKKQSKFIGSNRELRSRIIKHILSSSKAQSTEQIIKKVLGDSEAITSNLKSMRKEGLLKHVTQGWKTA